MIKKIYLFSIYLLIACASLFLTGCKNTETIPEIKNTFVFTLNYDEYGNLGAGSILEEYNSAEENVVIPDNYKGIPVKDIGERAFKNNKKIKTVYIPDSILVNSVDFYGCSNLERIILSEYNQRYKVENNCLLTKNGKELILAWNGAIIPDSVTIIHHQSFSSYTSLTEINIPAKVCNKFLNEWEFINPFKNCNNLKKITVDAESPYFTVINNCLLSKDETILYIGFETDEIPSSVTSIASNAFMINIKTAHIPSSITSIGTNIFEGCNDLKEIIVDENNLNYKSQGNCLLNKDGTRLIAGCTTSIIPEGVKIIKNYSFKGLTNLKTIKLPNTLENIDTRVFEDCTNLSDIQFPNSVRGIGVKVFNNCLSLKSLILPKNLLSGTIGSLGYCPSLESLKMPMIPNLWIISETISDCPNVKSLSIHEGYEKYQSINNCLIYDNILILGCQTSIIPDTVTSINTGAFANCINLKNINITNNITKIGINAFYNCRNLENITLPNSLELIGDNAFVECEQFTNFTIPSSVNYIGKSILLGCNNLTSITIPFLGSSIKEDDSTDIYYLFSGYNYYFRKTRAKIEKATLPSSLEEVIITGGTCLTTNAFIDCVNISKITLPITLTTISGSAFKNCTNIQTITIPKNITNMSNTVFSGWTSEQTIIFDAISSPTQYWLERWNAESDAIYIWDSPK